MSHKIIVVPVPMLKADGTRSEHRSEYQVIDILSRKKKRTRMLVGVRTNRKDAEKLRSEWRQEVFNEHLRNHPNDRAFRAKHGIGKENA